MQVRLKKRSGRNPVQLLCESALIGVKEKVATLVKHPHAGQISRDIFRAAVCLSLKMKTEIRRMEVNKKYQSTLYRSFPSKERQGIWVAMTTWSFGHSETNLFCSMSVIRHGSVKVEEETIMLQKCTINFFGSTCHCWFVLSRRFTVHGLKSSVFKELVFIWEIAVRWR